MTVTFPGARNESVRAALSERHRQMLYGESGNSLDVVAERGYRTCQRRDAFPPEFKRYQRRVPALVIPMYSPDALTTRHQIRPDKPRVRAGKIVKYETAGGLGSILDVHPSSMEVVRDRSCRLWITEGIRRVDSLTSRGLCTVGLTDVWNWQRKGDPLPCWDHVALQGRNVYVVFDSDVMVKPEVQLALERLAEFLQEHGAGVNVVYLPEVLRA
jgi:hypothetical protein